MSDIPCDRCGDEACSEVHVPSGVVRFCDFCLDWWWCMVYERRDEVW